MKLLNTKDKTNIDMRHLFTFVSLRKWVKNERKSQRKGTPRSQCHNSWFSIAALSPSNPFLKYFFGVTCPFWLSLLLSLFFCHQVVHLIHLVFRWTRELNSRLRTMAQTVSPRCLPIDHGASLPFKHCTFSAARLIIVILPPTRKKMSHFYLKIHKWLNIPSTLIKKVD